MRNIFYIFICILFLGSCADKLDLSPSDSLGEEIALNSDKNVKTVLNGAYDGLSSGNLYGGNLMRNAELLGGDNEVAWVGTFVGPREIANKQMTSSNGDANSFWLDGYNAINNANNVLASLSVVNIADQPTVEGEASFIRAMMLFDLVRFYAKPYVAGTTNSQLGVPIPLQPTRAITAEENLSRATDRRSVSTNHI